MDDNYIVNRIIDILNSQNSNLLIGNITSPRPGSICQISTKYGIKSAYNINCTYPGNAIVVWDKDEKQYYCFTNKPSTVLSSKKLTYRKNRPIDKKVTKENIAILVRDFNGNFYVLTDNSYSSITLSDVTSDISYNQAIIKKNKNNYNIYTQKLYSVKSYLNSNEIFSTTATGLGVFNTFPYVGNGFFHLSPVLITYTLNLISNTVTSFNANWNLRTIIYDCIDLNDVKIGTRIVETYIQKSSGQLATKRDEINIIYEVTRGYAYQNTGFDLKDTITYKNIILGTGYDITLVINGTVTQEIEQTGTSLTYLNPTTTIANNYNYKYKQESITINRITTVSILENNYSNYVINNTITCGNEGQYIRQKITKTSINTDVFKYYYKAYNSSTEIELQTNTLVNALFGYRININWIRDKMYHVKSVNLTTKTAIVSIYEIVNNELTETTSNIEVTFKAPSNNLIIYSASYIN